MQLATKPTHHLANKIMNWPATKQVELVEHAGNPGTTWRYYCTRSPARPNLGSPPQIIDKRLVLFTAKCKF